VLKTFKVVIEGPLWFDILHIANKKLMNLQEQVINRNFIRELKPMLTITKALAWDQIGSQILNRINLVNAIKIHGKPALKQRDVLNSFYFYLMNLRE
jgi:hypothetical protein